MFIFRTHDNPSAMPQGTSDISIHGTLIDARMAADRERREFASSGYATGGAYLQRIIFDTETGETHSTDLPWEDDNFLD